MLQQTRVETVVKYYERFLRRFPDLAALAGADHEDVLKHWEGLGYYRRILHLHRAAQIIHDRGGGIPSTAVELRALPGVGEYTAAAIASIAFNERAAAVDGNVARVIARLFGVSNDCLAPAGRARIRHLASQLLPRTRPGDFNQALMDLGSTVCTPQSPDCPRCPLARVCVAVNTNRAHALPVRGAGRNKKPLEVRSVVGIFFHDAKMLVRCRPTGGLWSGLWEFPNAELSTRSAPWRRLHHLATEHGLTVIGQPHKAGIVRHQLTHRALTFHVFAATVEPDDDAEAKDTSLRWVSAPGFRKLSVSTAHRRVFEAARDRIDALVE